MIDLQHEKECFIKLANLSGTILNLSSHQLASTEKTAYAKMLYEEVARQSFGIAQYIEHSPNISYEIEPSSLATLSRSLMESCENFHYNYIDVISKEEWYFKLALHMVHEYKEAGIIKKFLDLEDVNKIFEYEHFYENNKQLDPIKSSSYIKKSCHT